MSDLSAGQKETAPFRAMGEPLSSTRAAPRDSIGFAAQYWEHRLSERWGLHGAGYISFGMPFNRCLYAVRRRVFARHLQTLDINLQQARVLDVGSGTGFWLKVWDSLGVRSMTSLDLTLVSVERLKREYPHIRVVRADISVPETATMFDDRFDLISAFDVLFHILDDGGYRQALANVSQLLAPGGYFIFSEFFLHGNTHRGVHQVSRPIEQILGDLAACGLKAVLRVPMFVLMNAPVDVSARWPLLVWRLLMAPMRLIPALGFLYGAALSPIDLVLTRVLRESPTTEMMICQKSPSL